MRYSEEKKYIEQVECNCYKDVYPSQATKYQALSTAKKVADEADMTVTNSSFVEISPLGKYYEMVGKSPSPNGDLSWKYKGFLQRQCVLSIASVVLTSSSLDARGYAFINSVRDLSSPQMQPVSLSPAPPSEAVARLKVLKDAFDQKLITPSEYETKRQSILGGM
jgi:hypothetical protein